MSDETRAAEEAAAEFMRTVPVQDVVVSMVQTVFDVGYRRTGLVAEAGGERDLEQTRIAVETVRALLPVLEQMVDAASMTGLRAALAQLQLAYAQAVEAPGAAEGAPAEPASESPSESASGSQAPPPRPQPPAAERPEPRVTPARPKIWTPGGDR